jgi:hypothetical protein
LFNLNTCIANFCAASCPSSLSCTSCIDTNCAIQLSDCDAN